MFILKQRNLIFNVNEFTKNFNNFKNVNIDNNDNILNENTKFKVTKSKFFNNNGF